MKETAPQGILLIAFVVFIMVGITGQLSEYFMYNQITLVLYSFLMWINIMVIYHRLIHGNIIIVKAFVTNRRNEK